MKPSGEVVSVRTRGVRRRCIHDPRYMNFAVGNRRGRCIKTGNLSIRSEVTAVGGGKGIKTKPGQSVEIDRIVPPVHTERYE